MTFPIYQTVFFFFAAALIASAIMVIVSRNPVRSILFLVFCFFCAAVLWMMIQAEFLALVLIFVYVGAVMTLFLFVVMMLNVDTAQIKEGFMKLLPIGVALVGTLIVILFFILGPKHLQMAEQLPAIHSAGYSNTSAMGQLLFTQYLYPFEITAALLLVAIIAAIGLAFYGQRKDSKRQDLQVQHAANKAERLRVVDLKVGKP